MNVHIDHTGVFGNKKFVIGEFSFDSKYSSGGIDGLNGVNLGLSSVEHVSFQTPLKLRWDKESYKIFLYTNAGAELADDAPIKPKGPYTFFALGV